MGVVPNSNMASIVPISGILALIFPILLKYVLKCEGKGSFLKSKIKSLRIHRTGKSLIRVSVLNMKFPTDCAYGQ